MDRSYQCLDMFVCLCKPWKDSRFFPNTWSNSNQKIEKGSHHRCFSRICPTSIFFWVVLTGQNAIFTAGNRPASSPIRKLQLQLHLQETLGKDSQKQQKLQSVIVHGCIVNLPVFLEKLIGSLEKN